MNEIIFRQLVKEKNRRFEICGMVNGVFVSPSKCAYKFPIDLCVGYVNFNGSPVFVNDIVTLGDDEQFVVTGCGGGRIFFTSKSTGEPFSIKETLAHRMVIAGDNH